MTPFYERGGITIFCGEASEVMSQWDADSIDLTVTSPPYDDLRRYLGYTFDFPTIAGQLWRVTIKGGVVVWVVADATVNGSETGTSFRQALGFMGLGFNLHDTMIYHQINPMPYQHNRYQPAFEYMFVFSKKNPKSFNPLTIKSIEAGRKSSISQRESNNTKNQGNGYGLVKKETTFKHNIWDYSVGKSNTTLDDCAFEHPAIFPEALARDHIISWSNEGDIVCDPLLGSGTTAKIAQQLGRRFVGCEISEEYCHIAVDRLRQPTFFSIPADPQPATAEQAALW